MKTPQGEHVFLRYVDYTSTSALQTFLTYTYKQTRTLTACNQVHIILGPITVALDIITCYVFLFGTDSSRRHWQAIVVLWRDLDAHLHRIGCFPQLAMRGRRGLIHCLVHACGAIALLPFVLNKNKDIPQREVHLTLAAGKQVLVPFRRDLNQPVLFLPFLRDHGQQGLSCSRETATFKTKQ